MRDEATMVDVAGAGGSATMEMSSSPVGASHVNRPHVRVLHAVRHPANWLQLIRFGLVGGSGFVINLVLYAIFVHVFSIEYHVAAVLSWTLSAGSNFVLNRHWTFDGRHEKARALQGQTVRFALVSLVALGVDLAVLDTLVGGGMAKVEAEAIAVVASMPLNFLGNKLWTFRHAA